MHTIDFLNKSKDKIISTRENFKLCMNLNGGTVFDTDIKRIKITDETKLGNALKHIVSFMHEFPR